MVEHVVHIYYLRKPFCFQKVDKNMRREENKKVCGSGRKRIYNVGYTILFCASLGFSLISFVKKFRRIHLRFCQDVVLTKCVLHQLPSKHDVFTMIYKDY